MERIELELSQLTITQKLDLLETLWDDLARNEKAVESPDWHREILDDREKAVAAGKAGISSWEEAKERMRRNVKCK